MSDESKSFALVAEALPSVGTLIAICTVVCYGQPGNKVTTGQVACLSVLGKRMTIHDESSFDVQSRTDSVIEPISMFCTRHAKNVFNNLLIATFPNQPFPIVSYQESDKVQEVIRGLTSIGIGIEQLQKLSYKLIHLGETLETCLAVRSVTWKS